jgi:hypothetical protein
MAFPVLSGAFLQEVNKYLNFTRSWLHIEKLLLQRKVSSYSYVWFKKGCPWQPFLLNRSP